MALKTKLTDEEKYGLSEEEIKLATKWLRKNKTASALKELEAAKLFELFLLGEPISKLAVNFPQYPMGQICLTAALRKWCHDRDRMMHTLQDRVRAKVVKSVLDQVDFLTAMLSVSNAEHLSTMHKYTQDPINNPKPALRIETIKEYKDVAETLYKIVSGVSSVDTTDKKKSPLMNALSPPADKKSIADKDESPDEISILDVNNS
jgi:hypothetical protein